MLDRLGRLQALANSYVETEDSSADPIVLTLSYTRTGDYNTQMWQLTAGVRDAAFENYVNTNDSDLQSLQGMSTVTLPGGQNIDFSHLLASMNLVYNGIPITGSWGGDCMQLAKAYYGQASDEAGYADVMRATFAKDDDGSVSVFGDQDLRADIDSINVGAELTKDTDIATALRDYYQNLSANVVDYARAKQFIILNFGTVDTSADNFGDVIYETMLEDSGMQLLLYMNGMWTTSGWTVNNEYAPALHGAADLLAEWLANAVNNEKIKSDTNDRLVAMGGEALAEALAALGDSDAAAEAFFMQAGNLAARDGVLTEVSVTEGMRLCAVGDTVRQGQLLVSGYEDYGLFIRPVCASAEIYARTWHTGTVVTPAERLEKRYTGREWKQVTLIVGKKRIKLWGNSSISQQDCDKMIVEKAVRTSGYAYPLRLETAILREYVLEPAPAPQVQTEKLLQEAWRRAVQAQMLAGRIDVTQESLLMQGGLCILQAQSDCTELISRTLQLEAAD